MFKTLIFNFEKMFYIISNHFQVYINIRCCFFRQIWFNVERNELVWQLIKCKVLQMIDDWSCMHYLPFLILDYPFAMTLFYTAEWSTVPHIHVNWFYGYIACYYQRYKGVWSIKGTRVSDYRNLFMQVVSVIDTRNEESMHEARWNKSESDEGRGTYPVSLKSVLQVNEIQIDWKLSSK